MKISNKVALTSGIVAGVIFLAGFVVFLFVYDDSKSKDSDDTNQTQDKNRAINNDTPTDVNGDFIAGQNIAGDDNEDSFSFDDSGTGVDRLNNIPVPSNILREDDDNDNLGSDSISDFIEKESEGFKVISQYSGENKWEFTITGELPNPCYQTTKDVVVAESFPEQVTISLNIKNPTDDMMCTQVIQEVEVKGEYQASDGATLNFKVNFED